MITSKRIGTLGTHRGGEQTDPQLHWQDSGGFVIRPVIGDRGRGTHRHHQKDQNVRMEKSRLLVLTPVIQPRSQRILLSEDFNLLVGASPVCFISQTTKLCTFFTNWKKSGSFSTTASGSHPPLLSNSSHSSHSK